jgi:predicted ferric reductase
MSALTQSAALWYASRATGIVAVVLLSLVVILGVLVSSKVRLPGLPRLAVVALHRRICLIAVLFVAVHVLTAVADSYVSISLAAVVIPFTSAYRPLAVGLGAVALDLGIAVVGSSLLRARIGWRMWRRVHWLAYAAYPVAVLHGFISATDIRSGVLLAVTLACLAAVVGAIGYRLAVRARRQAPAARTAGIKGSAAQAHRERRSDGRAAAVR